ncbi:hypothetical protein [Cryptosporangium aurantiacum]|uniref:Uncharacterized protein n=1 Tax=Cryptosporangium aurantiacum TaxID=134849 RepID=A0A1M7TTT9_9ACTN|nr:hypothetical protein [Cryptosporangium aurantiacum]SHN74076.1 hypothetical protein SAMN05443668_10710 [Cryptosporangium aurantiacum]
MHVDAKLHSDAATRIVLADAFGLVSDLPTTVETGCGQRVPYAMTASRPEGVTCTACREFAAEQHADAAEQALRLARMPGIGVPIDDLLRAARAHRDLAERYREA